MTNTRKPAQQRGGSRPKVTDEPSVEEPFDILAEMAVAGGAPKPIKMLGVVARVRCQYTGDEAVTFFSYMANDEFENALKVVVGDEDGVLLWEKIARMNPSHASTALNSIINVSGLHSGKLLKPLPDFTLGPDGAQPSQDSASTSG